MATTSASSKRTILLSRTYQLRLRATNATNKFDKNNYSHAYVRALMAEQVVDVLNVALGVEETFAAQDGARCWHEVGRSGFEPPVESEAWRMPCESLADRHEPRLAIANELRNPRYRRRCSA